MGYTGGETVTRLNQLLIDNSTAPAEAPFMITPSAAPTGTQQAGEIYVGTDGSFYVSNGTVFVPAAGTLLAPKTAAATLTAADSGKVCFFTTAAGYTYTLPTAAAGLRFRFVCLVDITSVAAKVITASSSEFLLGSFIQSTDGTYTSAARAADGSTIRAWSGDGTATGGLAGD